MTKPVENTFVYLLGLPGVGKLTIARELTKHLPAKLLDNHKINNLVFEFALHERGKPIPEEVWVEIRKIRKILIDVIVNLAPHSDNYVLTNVLLQDDEHDLSIFNSYLDAAKNRNARLMPVTLTCDKGEHFKRFGSPERPASFKMSNPEGLQKMIDSGDKPLRPNHPLAFQLDVTHLTAAQACEKIIAHIEALP